jgi:acetylglutamate kinase
MMEDMNDPTKMIDVGQVGEITAIDPSIINFLDSGDFIPVVAQIGVGEDG